MALVEQKFGSSSDDIFGPNLEAQSPTKDQYFSWRLTRNILLNGDNLMRRNVGARLGDFHCPSYSDHNESIMLTLFYYLWVQDIWMIYYVWLKISLFDENLYLFMKF